MASFGLFGFVMNFKPGKTEVVHYFNGKNSAIQKRRLAHDLSFKIPLDLRSGERAVLHCVYHYKHLGTNLAMCESMAPEVTMRANAISADVKRF